MIEFSRGFLCAWRIAISREDRVLFSITHIAWTIFVRHICQRSVHPARRQFGIGNRAEAAGFVDVDLAAMLRRGKARCQQECHGDQHVRRRRFDDCEMVRGCVGICQVSYLLQFSVSEIADFNSYRPGTSELHGLVQSGKQLFCVRGEFSLHREEGCHKLFGGMCKT
jgi:hypothetical protein